MIVEHLEIVFTEVLDELSVFIGSGEKDADLVNPFSNGGKRRFLTGIVSSGPRFRTPGRGSRQIGIALSTAGKLDESENKKDCPEFCTQKLHCLGSHPTLLGRLDAPAAPRAA